MHPETPFQIPPWALHPQQCPQPQNCHHQQTDMMTCVISYGLIFSCIVCKRTVSFDCLHFCLYAAGVLWSVGLSRLGQQQLFQLHHFNVVETPLFCSNVLLCRTRRLLLRPSCEANRGMSYCHITLLLRSCIRYRQPAPDPHQSRTSSQLSIICWHLNLPINLALTLTLN